MAYFVLVAWRKPKTTRSRAARQRSEAHRYRTQPRKRATTIFEEQAGRAKASTSKHDKKVNNSRADHSRSPTDFTGEGTMENIRKRFPSEGGLRWSETVSPKNRSAPPRIAAKYVRRHVTQRQNVSAGPSILHYRRTWQTDGAKSSHQRKGKCRPSVEQ